MFQGKVRFLNLYVIIPFSLHDKIGHLIPTLQKSLFLQEKILTVYDRQIGRGRLALVRDHVDDRVAILAGHIDGLGSFVRCKTQTKMRSLYYLKSHDFN